MLPTELEGVTHRYHELSTGVRAHVAHAGPEDAPAVLALHGFPQHWYCWRHVIAALRDDVRVLAMDTRGLGWSGPAPDGDYRKARLADDAVALLDDLGIQTAVLAGHDWGGWAGWHAALDHPDRFMGYVATGIPHPWQPIDRILAGLPRLAYQPPLATPVLGPWLVPRVAGEIIRRAWGDGAPEEVEVFAAAYRDPARAEAASRYYRSFLTREAPGSRRGQRLTIPTCLLYGAKDPIGSALARGIERHGDDARLTMLEGCGHFVPEERPDAVVEALRAILERDRHQ